MTIARKSFAALIALAGLAIVVGTERALRGSIHRALCVRSQK